MGQLDPENLDAVFTTLVGCAARGERCPENQTHGVTSAVVGALARAGRIKVEVYALNYRVVEILVGEHRGKRTREHHGTSPPWKTTDKNGTRVNGKPQQRARRGVPISLYRGPAA